MKRRLRRNDGRNKDDPGRHKNISSAPASSCPRIPQSIYPIYDAGPNSASKKSQSARLFLEVQRFGLKVSWAHPAGGQLFAGHVALVESAQAGIGVGIFFKNVAAAEHARVVLFFELRRHLLLEFLFDMGVLHVLGEIVDAVGVALKVI